MGLRNGTWRGAVAVSACSLLAGFGPGVVALAGAASSELTLYEDRDLRGDNRTFTKGERDLDRSGWEDRAESVRIRRGSWELCRDRDYRDCTVFAPGEFELRGTRLDRRLRSIRPFGDEDEDDEPAYTRRQARYISNRLYRALLERDVDPDSVRAMVEEVEEGKVRDQISSILRSSEFRRRQADLTAEAMLEQIYQGLLGRAVDAGGRRTYVSRVERRDYAGVVLAIIDSSEFRDRMGR